MKLVTIQPGEAITIRFTEQERELIRDHTFAESDLTDRLLVAPNGDDLLGSFTLDDLDDLLGHLAAESNHTDDDRLRAELDLLYDRLQLVEQSHVEA